LGLMIVSGVSGQEGQDCPLRRPACGDWRVYESADFLPMLRFVNYL
jgi:hypothetical protein